MIVTLSILLHITIAYVGERQAITQKFTQKFTKTSLLMHDGGEKLLHRHAAVFM